MGTAKTSRNARIDRLRGVAIAIAVMSHTPGFMSWDFRPFLTDILPLHTNGCFGVAIFFVISGFLITRKLISMNDMPAVDLLRTFYVQRVGRLAPCLALVVLLAWVLSTAGLGRFVFSDGGFERFLTCVLTLQYNHCIIRPGLPDVLNHLWSLSVEEVFYLFFPIIVIATRSRPYLLMTLLMGLVLYGPLQRARVVGADVYTFFGNFDLLAMGCIAAICSPSVSSHHSDLRYVGLAILAGTFFGVTLTTNLIWPPTMVGIGAALYMMGAIPAERPSAVILRPLELAGDLSYEMYLFHFPILGLIVKPIYDMTIRTPGLAPAAGWISLATLLVALFGISYLLARYYSEKLNHRIRLLARMPFELAHPGLALHIFRKGYLSNAGPNRQA